jgi:hypothetical protein
MNSSLKHVILPLVTLLILPFTAFAGWEAVTVETLPNNWERVDIGYAYDAGNGWKFLPQANTWVFIADAGIDPNATGWHLAGYAFTDASYVDKESVLAGTTSVMVDNLSFIGGRGDITITHTRIDKASGDLLASQSYRAIWSEPPHYIAAGSRPQLDLELTLISYYKWQSIPQNSVYFNQGFGAYFESEGGTRYFTSDISARLILSASVAPGPAPVGAPRIVQVNLGAGYTATYTYAWQD